MTNYPPPAQPYAPYPAEPRHRPLGVTLMAILEILMGLGSLLVALAFFLAGFALDLAQLNSQYQLNLPQWLVDTAPMVFAVIGLVFLIIAIVWFLIAWGFLRGKRWARILAIIWAVLSILGTAVSAFASGSLFNIATIGISALIPIIILLYMFLPHAKAWFTE